MSEQAKSTGRAGGGGIDGGWLWRISQGLKAGIQAERRCVCVGVRGAVYKSFGG